jgi:hypothetical protein
VPFSFENLTVFLIDYNELLILLIIIKLKQTKIEQTGHQSILLRPDQLQQDDKP